VLGILRLRCAQSGNVFAILVVPVLLTHDEYVNDIAINNFAEGAGAEWSLHTSVTFLAAKAFAAAKKSII
jgi:hypothetical protein